MGDDPSKLTATTATTATTTASTDSAAESRSSDPGSPVPKATSIELIQHDCLMNAEYHSAREGFMDTFHRWLLFTVIVSGSGAVIAFSSAMNAPDWVPSALGASAALSATFDLVFDLSNRARSHSILKRRYYELLADLEAGSKTEKESQSELYLLCAEEEPVYNVLLKSCWNNASETLYGDDREEYLISKWHRFWQNWFKFSHIRFEVKPYLRK